MLTNDSLIPFKNVTTHLNIIFQDQKVELFDIPEMFKALASNLQWLLFLMKLFARCCMLCLLIAKPVNVPFINLVFTILQNINNNLSRTRNFESCTVNRRLFLSLVKARTIVDLMYLSKVVTVIAQ